MTRKWRLNIEVFLRLITQSKKEVSCLKHNSDLLIAARDILIANKIENQEELSVALKRVDHL